MMRMWNRMVKKPHSVQEYVEGVRNGNRTILAQTITLVESHATKHQDTAQAVLNELLPYTGNSIRLGITGVPGAGKSTFIEAIGTFFCNLGHRVAVLAVDPTSTITGGSILGDKTRMEALSKNERAFVRPSPSGKTLGGVARKTRETILLCEAAGFDVILIETIGVGQSEVAVRGMVDFFLLLVLTGAGDELQGMKKGVMELTDALVIHKADGVNKQNAELTKNEYNQILHFIAEATPGWRTMAYTVSSLTGEGISEMVDVIRKFVENGKKSGQFEIRRKQQLKEWVFSMIRDQLEINFFSNLKVKQELPTIEQKVVQGKLSPSSAAYELLRLYEKDL